jgi:hypothetical protein
VELEFIRKTGDSQQGHSPTLYATDRGTFVVQGYKVTDPAALAALNLPDHETAVEVPADVLAEIAAARGQ